MLIQFSPPRGEFAHMHTRPKATKREVDKEDIVIRMMSPWLIYGHAHGDQRAMCLFTRAARITTNPNCFVAEVLKRTKLGEHVLCQII